MPVFGKASRIKGADDFLAVKKRGRSVRAGCVVVAAVVGPRRRLGIIVTRRVGNAVHRNRIRRVVREFFRNNRQAFPVGDCVVIPMARAEKITNDELRSCLVRALSALAGKMEREAHGAG
jgi:ribonuclease P protein component